MAFNEYQLTDGGWIAANFSLGHIPDTTDQSIIPASTPVAINGVDAKGTYPAHLEFARGYLHNIGTSIANPLIIGGQKIVHNGSGTLFIKSDDNATTDFIDWLIVDSDNRTLAAHVDGETVTRTSIRKGAVTLASTLGTVTLPTQVDVSFRNNPSSDANVTIDCAMHATLGLLNVMAGLCTANNTMFHVDVTGGIYVHSNANSTTATRLQIGGTGIVRWNTTGTLPLANVMNGGTLDLLNNQLGKTVTEVNLFPGGTLIYNPDLFTGTVNDLGGREVILQDGPAPFATLGGGAT